NTTKKGGVNPGRLDLPFINPPVGFEGNNGLWLQADQVEDQLRITFANAEANYRCWNTGVNGPDLLLGVRDVNYAEALGIHTDDEGARTRDIDGKPDPLRIAVYRPNVRNNIVAPQIGFEWAGPVPYLPDCLCKRVWVGIDAKVGLGVNFLNSKI